MEEFDNLENVTKDVMKFLDMCGFWFYFDTSRKFRFVLQISQNLILHYLLFYTYLLIYDDGIKELLSDKYMYVTATTASLILQHAFYIKQKEFGKLVNTFQIVLAKYPDERKYMITEYMNTWKCVKYFNNYLIIVIVTFFFTPCAIDGIYYLLGFDEFASSIPKPVNRIRGMTQGRLHHWLTLACGAYYGFLWASSYSAVLTSSFIILTLTYIEMKLLKQKIVKDYKNELLNNVENIFTEIISRQCDIKRLHKIVLDAVGASLGIKNAVIAAALCYVLFGAVAAKSAFATTCFIFGFITFLTDSFITCYVGELISNEGEEISESLYDLPWYTLPPKDRRDFALILLQGQVPTEIDYRGILATKLETFMQICQSAYSYYMILNSMK